MKKPPQLAQWHSVKSTRLLKSFATFLHNCLVSPNNQPILNQHDIIPQNKIIYTLVTDVLDMEWNEITEEPRERNWIFAG